MQHAAVPSPAGNGNTCYLSIGTFLNTEKVQSKCGIKEKKWYLALTTNGTPRTGRCSVCVSECAGRRRGHDRAAGTLHTLPRGPALLPRGRKSTRSCRCCRRTETGPGPVRDTEEELAGRGRDHLQPGCREGLKGGLRPGRSKKSRRKGEGTRDCRGSVVLVTAWWSSGQLQELYGFH